MSAAAVLKQGDAYFCSLSSSLEQLNSGPYTRSSSFYHTLVKQGTVFRIEFVFFQPSGPGIEPGTLSMVALYSTSRPLKKLPNVIDIYWMKDSIFVIWNKTEFIIYFYYSKK